MGYGAVEGKGWLARTELLVGLMAGLPPKMAVLLPMHQYALCVLLAWPGWVLSVRTAVCQLPLEGGNHLGLAGVTCCSQGWRELHLPARAKEVMRPSVAFISIYSIAWVKLTIKAARSDMATFV